MAAKHVENNGPPITWTPITKKTLVPGLEIEKGKKYFRDSGELGVGARTTYILESQGRGGASLGIVNENRHGILWPGRFETTESARAAAFEYERTGEMPRKATSLEEQMAVQLGGFVSKDQAVQRIRDAVALAAQPFPASKGSELIALDRLIEHPKNPRHVFGKLEELAASIESTHGLLVPIIARPHPDKSGFFQIVGGARRHRALELLRKSGSPYAEKVLVDIRSLTDAQAFEAMMTENDRENLAPLEEARGYSNMLDTGHTVDTIALTLGVSKGTVHGRLKLLELSPAAVKLFEAGVLTTAIATPLGRYPKELQQEALEQMFDDKNREGAGGPALWRYDGSYSERHSSGWGQPKKLNVGDAIAWLQEHFTKSLKSTAFDQADATIQVSMNLWPTLQPLDTKPSDDHGEVTAPACKACPKNSNNMPHEVAGENAHGRSNAGFCTLPPCFDEKWTAAVKKMRSEAKEKGDVKVLGAAQSAAAMRKDQFGRETKYARLSEVNHRDPKKRTYGQLLELANKNIDEGDQIRKVLAVSEQGKAQLVNREEVEKVLAATGELPKAKAESAGHDHMASHRRAEAKRSLRKQVSFELLEEYAQHLREKGPTLPALRGLVDSTNNYDSAELELRIFGLKNERELDAFVEKKATMNDLVALLYVRQVAGDIRGAYTEFSDETERSAKELKVDLKKREKATVITEGDE